MRIKCFHLPTLVLLMLFGVQGVFAGGILPPQAMIGHWAGEGEIAVNWTKQLRLRLDIVISADGKVTGKVGDAEIIGSHFGRNRPVARWFGNPPYMIRVKLNGALIQKEDIVRKGGYIVLDVKGDHLEGFFHSTGWHIGTRKTMWMAVFKVILEPVG
ncbi:MAG: hypothetical protein WC602_05500 [archaeon]